MFNLSQKYAVDRPILKYNYLRYTLPSLNLVSGETNQIFIDITREGSAFSLKDSYFQIVFNVTHRACAHARYADGDLIKLVNLAPIVQFHKNRLTSSSGEEIEEIDISHVICSMYKTLSSSRDSDVLSFCFHRSIDARERELTNKKATNGNCHVRNFSKDVFGLEERQDSCTYGLG